jgi:hypothetical protein
MRTLGFSEYAERSRMGVPPMSCWGLTGDALGSSPASNSSAPSTDVDARASRIWEEDHRRAVVMRSCWVVKEVSQRFFEKSL